MKNLKNFFNSLINFCYCKGFRLSMTGSFLLQGRRWHGVPNEGSISCKTLTPTLSLGEGGRKRVAFTLAEGATHVGNFAGTRKFAFTLAEVLITIGIIGVVAAMTIPNLLYNYKVKKTVSDLTKVYATLNEAYRQAIQEYGPVSDWVAGETDDDKKGKIVSNNMKKYLRVSKDCGTSPGCFTSGRLKSLRGITNFVDYDNSTEGYKIILLNGTSIMFWSANNIKVDIDGKYKGNYHWGEDVFIFRFYNDTIVPEGLPNMTPGNNAFRFENYCKYSSNNSKNGTGCAAWVIKNKNMDYLKCDGLSWEGKHSCSE